MFSHVASLGSVEFRSIRLWASSVSQRTCPFTEHTSRVVEFPCIAFVASLQLRSCKHDVIRSTCPCQSSGWSTYPGKLEAPLWLPPPIEVAAKTFQSAHWQAWKQQQAQAKAKACASAFACPCCIGLVRSFHFPPSAWASGMDAWQFVCSCC
jgi:hypothetical protein